MAKKILIVDDNKTYLKALLTKLKHTFPAYTYDIASNATQTHDLIKHNIYDFCIIDLILPDSHDGSLIKELIEQKNKVIDQIS
jgi:DNA-binding NtrC family response regulator